MSEKCGCEIQCVTDPVVWRERHHNLVFCDLHARAERTKRERDALLKAAVNYLSLFAHDMDEDFEHAEKELRAAVAACEKEEPSEEATRCRACGISEVIDGTCRECGARESR